MAKIEQNTTEAADLLPAESQPVPDPIYRVLSPVLHGVTDSDQRRYEIGETIALPKVFAAPLLAVGAISPVEEMPAPEPT